MEEFDLYGDLDDFDFKVKFEEAEATVRRFAAQLADASKEIERLEGDNEVLKVQSRALQNSFQALLFTSRSEIRRKDALLAASRKELDDMIFRKGLHSSNRQQLKAQVECSSAKSNEIHIDKHFRCDKNDNEQKQENYSIKSSFVPNGDIRKYRCVTDSKLDDIKSSANHINEVSHVSKVNNNVDLTYSQDYIENKNSNKSSKYSRNEHVREGTDKATREKRSPRKRVSSHEKERIHKRVRDKRSPRRSTANRDREKRSPRRSSVHHERERTDKTITEKRSPRRSSVNHERERTVKAIREERFPSKSSHERETTDRTVREKTSPRRRSVNYERERTDKAIREKRSHRH